MSSDEICDLEYFLPEANLVTCFGANPSCVSNFNSRDIQANIDRTFASLTFDQQERGCYAVRKSSVPSHIVIEHRKSDYEERSKTLICVKRNADGTVQMRECPDQCNSHSVWCNDWNGLLTSMKLKYAVIAN